MPKISPFLDSVEKCGTAREATDYNTTRRMRIACWIPKATETHLEYAILIAFPLHQWLRERATMSRYTYIASIVNCSAPKITCQPTETVE